MRIVRLSIMTVLILMLSACAVPPQQSLSTPSGNPEVTLPNANRKQVIDRIVASKLALGMQIKSVNDYGVTVTKRIEGNFAASFLYGSRYDSVPEARITYNVVEYPGGVKVFSRAEVITNPGSAYERVTDATQSQATQMQAELESLRY